MSVVSEWVHYGQGAYTGYVARPEDVAGPLPAVIIIQEIWGLDAHIQDVTRRFAEAGFVAFAPDLFSRNQSREAVLEAPRVAAAQAFLNAIPSSAWRNPEERAEALAGYPEAEQIQITETLNLLLNLQTRWSDFVQQLQTTSQFLRDEYEPTQGQGVASVGFCLGGALSAALAGHDPALRGGVIFYGNPPSPELLANIKAPLLGLYGELDTRISEQIPGFAEQAEAADKSFEYYIYPAAQHAFFNDTRPSYHAASAKDAYERTLKFLRGVLADR
ncbi:carboxymethylenebutenolidase [Paenibacillus marchantiophytorum]|uniref:Carboxymethylenebutenolidase n=1 Tax=Paenibacillus marchantiophytorum TaxID=1619310 RepID=A0ABQ1F5P5_9BACL|nr:dienelactone hydrolase family protein [Paenibacillus marchantiophytorum]GGA00082.1 carboxymethylenebutenolidase [Paenibacillus marchantiophytorum]